MKALVFETNLGFVLTKPELTDFVRGRLRSATCVGSLETLSLGAMTATMLEDALEERGLFEIGPHAARLLFSAAGGLQAIPTRASA